MAMKADEDDDVVIDSEEESDKDIYSNDADEDLLENDEISPGEAGFMEGYSAKELEKCSLCKKALDLEKAILRQVEDEELTFCSEKCANLYGKKLRD